MTKPVTKETFIQRSQTIHGNSYTYNSVVFVNTKTKVSITCPKHGDFLQRPYSHLEGAGCPKCNWENKKTVTASRLIEIAKRAHDDFYDYSCVRYTGPGNNVEIVCPTHGSFYMELRNHAMGKNRCPLCGSGKRRTTDDFITLAREVHGDLYDYSLAEYVNATTKVKIICNDHGVFEITPDTHCYSNQQGCPHCKASKGERRIYVELVKLGVEDFMCEKTFDDCVAPGTGLPLKYDFYLPSHNVLIEYDGQQHYEKVNFNNRLSEEAMQQRLERTRELDAVKTEYAKANGYSLIRIPFWEYGKINSILQQLIVN